MRHHLIFRGRTSIETVRKLMQSSLSNSVALNFNLTGRGKSLKKSFEQLKLYTVLLGKIAILNNATVYKIA